MFLTNCQHCGRRELASERSITGLHNTADGIELHYRCRACRRSNVVLTGAHTARRALRPAV